MISVIIPVLDEEKALPLTLTSLMRQAGDYEVTVVDGGSRDRTCDIAQADKRIKLLTAARGRGSQMNAGARVARGEWLLFLHADTQLPDGALTRINALENDAACLAGGFQHRFSGQDWRLGLVSWLDNLRCRVTGIFYGDQALFVRRSLFEDLGGFPEDTVMEDVLFGEKLARVTRPRLFSPPVTTDARKFIKMGVWRAMGKVALILVCHELRLPLPAKDFFADIR
jgi:rSAM/selenodomain-associated transferase 2